MLILHYFYIIVIKKKGLYCLKFLVTHVKSYLKIMGGLVKSRTKYNRALPTVSTAAKISSFPKLPMRNELIEAS
jgi:hypothetical protein